MSDLKVTVGADISAYQAGMQQASQTVKTFSTEASQSLAQAAQSTEALGGSAQSASMRFMQMRSGISAARDGVMAFTLGGQAAERSLMAMGHHINSLVNETGSFKGAMAALGSSLLGPGGIILGLTVAVELFEKFSKAQKDAVLTGDEYANSLDSVSKAMLKGEQAGQQEITRLKILYDATQNHTLSLKSRNQAYDELEKKYPQYFTNADREKTLLGQNIIAYNNLAASIMAAANAKAYESQIGENSDKIFESQNKRYSLEGQKGAAQGEYNRKLADLKKQYPGIPESELKTLYGPQLQGDLGNVIELQKQINDLKKTENDLTKQNQQLNRLATNAEVKAGFKTEGEIEKKAQKVKEADDGFAIYEAKITELQNKLEDAIMNHDKPTVIQALGKQIDEATDKLAKLRHEEALALMPHLDDTLLTLDKPLTTGIGKGKLSNGNESDEVSRIDLGQQKLQSDDIDSETKSMIKAVEAFRDYSEWLSKTRKAQKDFTVDTKNENAAAKELTNTIGKGLVSAFESAMNGTQSFVASMGKFIEQLIEKLVAAAAAAAILSVLLNATGIGGILGLSSATTSFSGLFGSLSGLGGVMNSLPQHAEGGIATSASIGVFGEAGPEALIPLNRMHEFTGGGASGQHLEVTHKLSGADLLLTITRAQKQQSRLS